MQTQILFSILIGSVLSSSPAKPQGAGLKAAPLSDATPVVNWPSSGNFLNALTDMGLQNRVPIGIVIQGDSICTGRPRNRGAIVTIRDIVKDLESQAPDYTAEIKDNTLFIHPKLMSASTEATLHLLISEFRTKPGTAYMDGIALWMHIRAKLVPEQGSAFEGQIPPTPDTLPPIRMTHATVEEILDRIVTAGNGGLWVMSQVPSDWQLNPKSIPYKLYSYAGGVEGLKDIRCPDKASQ